MKKNTANMRWALGLALALGTMRLAWAGPPFMTDDPEPIEYQHSEAIVFSTFTIKCTIRPGTSSVTRLHRSAPSGCTDRTRGLCGAASPSG